MKPPMHPTDALMIGESRAMQEVRAQIATLGPTSLSVLIQGETGSGKELVARALHDRSERAGHFVPVNVCAISDAMFEDSFFGHVRGAFTGAVADRQGYFAEADRGTIFLDEIGDLHLGGQTTLLRVLETREYRRVGDRRDHHSDFRVVAATNQIIAARVGRGSFRADLAFRIQDAVISVPPLRERRQDIGLIAQHIAATAQTPGGEPGSLSMDAVRVLEAYHWPGNVRELKQVVRRALAYAHGTVIGLAQLERAWPVADDGSGIPRLSPSDDGARRLIVTMEQCDWDTVIAAGALGVCRKTVYDRLKQFGILIPRRYRRRSRAPDAMQSGVETQGDEA